MKALAILAAIVLLAVAGISYEVSLWKECRAQHSWGYCVRVLSK